MKSGMVFCLVLVWPVTLNAAVGDLQPVKATPEEALGHQGIRGSSEPGAARAKDDGTVNESAAIVTLKNGPLTIKVALDSRKPDAKAPDVVRLDFTGRGRFDDTAAVPVKSGNGSTWDRGQGAFGPASLDVPLNGKTVPVTVGGMYYKSGPNQFVGLSLCTGLEGTCAFGDKAHPVRLIDGDSNLRLGDASSRIKMDNRVVGVKAGDTLVLDTGAGKFQPQDVRKCFYGQPVLVDGTWYRVTVSPDGSKVSSAPLAVTSGKIKIPHDQWRATFIGETYILAAGGGAAPIDLPADRYLLADYQEIAKLPNGEPAVLERDGRRALYTGTATAIDLPADKTVQVAAGSPLTGRVEAVQTGRQVLLSLSLLDAAGADVSDVAVAKDRPAAPRIEIRDAAGKTVHKAAMEYG